MLRHPFRTSLADRVSWFSQMGSLREPMVALIDKIQDLPGHFQILSVALTLYCLCKGGGVDYIEVMKMIERMESDIDGPYSRQFAGMREYAKHELNQ